MENSNIMENQDTRSLFNIQHSSEDMGNECGKDSQTHDGEEVFVCNRTKRRRKPRGLGPVAQVRRKLESLYNAVSGKEKEDDSKQGDLTEVTYNLSMVLTRRTDNYNDENNDNNDDNDDNEEHEDDGQDEQEYYEQDEQEYYNNMGQDDDDIYNDETYNEEDKDDDTYNDET